MCALSRLLRTTIADYRASWPTDSKYFTTWSFMEIFADPWCKLSSTSKVYLFLKGLLLQKDHKLSGLKHCHLLSYSFGRQEPKNGFSWAKIKVLVGGVTRGSCWEESISSPFLAFRGHREFLIYGQRQQWDIFKSLSLSASLVIPSPLFSGPPASLSNLSLPWAHPG